MWVQPGQAMLLPAAQTPAPEVITSHQADFTQAIAEQRQAELVAAAAQYRLARQARAAARGRGTTPLRPRGRRATRQLVGGFGRRHATT
jgi:hypothetical protein